MIKKIITFSVSMLVLFPVLASASFGSKQPFAADIYYKEAGGRDRPAMRAFFAMDKIRLEPMRGGKGGGIVRFDKDVVWVLNHRKRVYVEMPLEQIPATNPMDLDGMILQRTKLGSERRNGVMCTKSRLRYQDPASSRLSTAIAWYGKALGTYMRIEKSDGSVLSLRNVRHGPQPTHLFEVPHRYILWNIPMVPGPYGQPMWPRSIASPPWYDRSTTTDIDPWSPDVEVEAVLRDGRLFVNSDFEDGSLYNWTASGEAFRFQPIMGDRSNPRRSKRPAGHQKRYYIGTYEKYRKNLKKRPSRIQGDKPTGTLISVPFVITHERIEFLIGGGNRIADTYVALLVNGKVVRRATGHNSDAMRKIFWKVRTFAGREARLLIADKACRQWGHISADNFRYSGRALVDVHSVPGHTRPRTTATP